MSTNSFDAKATLSVGDRDFEIFRLDALQAQLRRRAAAVLAEDPAREPAAQRGRRDDPRATTSRRSRAGTRRPQPSKEIAFTPGARRDAGLHRRARRRRPRRDARRDGRDGRRPRADQPARAGRARDRPLGPGRRVRHARRVRRERRAASSSATRSATRSCAGARARSRASRSCRRTPGIVHQVNLEYLARVVFVERRARTRRIPTRSSAPTRTRRWSTASACSAGASAASRPRRRCSASRCRC